MTNMKTSKAVTPLAILIGLLTILRCGVGLFWQDGGSPFPFTTLHGQIIRMYGQGIYHFDPYFVAPILRGTDAVTLFIGVPLLVLATILYRRGSLRGAIFLTSLLVYFLYNAASYAFGVAYNNLFMVYLLSFSASLAAFILAFRSIDQQDLAARVTPGFPYRGAAALLFLSAIGLLFAWLPDVMTGLLQGHAIAIDSYTTEVTYVLDLGIIVPVLILTGVLLLRRAPASHLAAPILLIMLALIGLVITAQCIAQSLAGITLGIGEFIGKAGSFMLLALIAVGLIVRMFRHITGPPVTKSAGLKPA